MNNCINSSVKGLLYVRNGGKYKLLWQLEKLEYELIFLKKTVGHDSTLFLSISAEEQLFHWLHASCLCFVDFKPILQ